MSYSFTFTAASKDEAKSKIVSEMQAIVAGQPSHAKDRDVVVTAATAFVDMLGEVTEGHEVHVWCHGSIGWHHAPDAPPVPETLLSGQSGISVNLRKVQANG